MFFFDNVWQVQQFAPVPEIDEDAAPLLFGGCNCTIYAAGSGKTPTAWPDAASAPLNGWLDAVRVWSRALKPQEIASLARSGPADTGSEKVLSIVTLCSKYTMALTFQKNISPQRRPRHIWISRGPRRLHLLYIFCCCIIFHHHIDVTIIVCCHVIVIVWCHVVVVIIVSSGAAAAWAGFRV